MVRRVAADEFYAHDRRYNQASARGRELLFLIANHEWVRATSEIIDVSRSKVVGATLKVDIDLGHITHEAFRGRTGRIWLPIAVLPPQWQRNLELDLFATVTDAAGNLLPLLPADELRWQLSAALAEIMVNMAAAHMRSSESSRDERVLLSAAIYRLLQDPDLQDDGHLPPEGADTASESARPDAETTEVLETPRVSAARDALLALIDPYIGFLLQRARMESPREQFVPELAHRAIIVLNALADSVVIVVPADCAMPPTVLTVRVPDRPLTPTAGPSARRKPSTWRVGFSGHLAVDLLLPGADANRQIQVELPDGVSLKVVEDRRQEGQAPGGSKSNGSNASIDRSGSAGHDPNPLPPLNIVVRRPPAVEEFLASLGHVLDCHGGADVGSSVHSALVDFARAKAAVAVQSLRYYQDLPSEPGSDGATDLSAEPGSICNGLKELAGALNTIDVADQVTEQSLRALFDRTRHSPASLCRSVPLRRTGPRTLLTRSEMIPELGQRAAPERATVHLDVQLDVRDYLSAATRSASMSLVLMSFVLAFLLGFTVLRSKTSPAAEVLAIALTLFATIQASRISVPDPSTLRGKLSVVADWLIAGSMLPPVVLAVALAFVHGWAAVGSAGGLIILQALELFAMLHGPLAPAGTRRSRWYTRLRIGQPQGFRTDAIDYSRMEPLRSDYWRNTTADALMIGRLAHAYVVWQGAAALDGAQPLLAPLLRPHGAAVSERSSVLALLHSSTQKQAMTFVVFRGQPDSGWAAIPNAQVRELELDPDRLAPMDNVTDTVDVFIGIHASEMPVLRQHPLLAAIEAARNMLILLEVELPVPPPDPRYRDRQWARARVAVRDSRDLGRLTRFLGNIRSQVGESALSGLTVAVQTVPTAPARIILHTAEPRRAGTNKPILTGDLDVSYVRGLADEPPDAKTWRMIVMCAEARSNIESDLIRHLIRKLQAAPHGLLPEPWWRSAGAGTAGSPEDGAMRFQLAHLNYARLHGTAVIVLLLHDRGKKYSALEPAAGGHMVGRDADTDGPEWGQPQVIVDEAVSLRQLGQLVQYPLLRIRFRWQDRPGVIANILRSINDALSKEKPPIDPASWSVSYARVQVANGHTALGYLTVRIHDPAHGGKDWTTPKTGRLARRVASALAGLSGTATEGDSESANDRHEMEGPVIRLDLISRSS